VSRAYVAAHFALELDLGDHAVMGFLRSVDGGGISTDVQTYQQGAIADLWRQVGRPKFADISLQVGMGLAKVFYDWIADFFKGKVTRASGAIIGADFNYCERSRRTFDDALISEVQIPTLEGSSKEPALMTVKIVPEAVRFSSQPTGGAKIEAPQNMRQPNKVWHCANFTFTVDGFAPSFNRVTKIEQFSIKQQILEYPSGHRRTALRIPGRMDFPLLSVYVPMVDADKLMAQATSRLIDYKKPPQGGMTGAIELRAPDKSVLCTIKLKGVDIVSAEPQKLDATAETFDMCKVQIQVEAMEFDFKG
jgi:hypothetical protein